MEESHRSPENDNASQTFEQLKSALAACLRRYGVNTFEEREAAVLRIVNDAAREVLRDELQRRSEELPDEVLVDGILHRKHQPGVVTIHSLCGSFEVLRWTYRRTGERNGRTCAPLELEAGIVERATPALARGIMQAYALSHMREHERALEAAHRSPPSRSTLERIAKALGQRTKVLTRTVEPLLRRAESLPEGAHGIVLGLDRTTIPMEELPESPAARCSGRKRNKPYVRRAPPPIEVKYRMAYVGTVTIVDANANPLLTRRYAVGAHETAPPLLRRMSRDLRASLEAKPDLVVGVVQDAACELRNLMLDVLRAERLVKKYYFVVDYYHVTEHLALVAKTIEPDEIRRKKQLVRWKRALLRNDHAIYEICKKLDRLLMRWWQDPSKRRAWRELHQQYCYLHGNAFHMRYARIASLGIPVGSGVTEGACKSMIASRLKRSGQRWHTDGVDAVLAIRSLIESDRFERYWQHFQREHRATVRAA